jgi:hypothetical protein
MPPAGLISYILEKNGVVMLAQISIQGTIDPNPAINALANALSWRLATTEAIISLIHSGILVAVDHTEPLKPVVVQFDDGGYQSRHALDETCMWLPGQVRCARSFSDSRDQFLAEPDLYLNTLNISNMHPDLVVAFRESVRCFRHELYNAAVAMLGKASEGAWIELGTSLLAAVPSDRQDSVVRQRRTLENPKDGAAKKIDAVVELFEKQDIFKSISSMSGVALDEFRSAADWSDPVRDSRNTIHFGVKPVTPNTYETVAVLLLGAVRHMKVLYRLKAAADASSASSTIASPTPT